MNGRVVDVVIVGRCSGIVGVVVSTCSFRAFIDSWFWHRTFDPWKVSRRCWNQLSSVLQHRNWRAPSSVVENDDYEVAKLYIEY